MTMTYRPSADRLVDETEAAEMLGIARQTLAVWRCRGRYSLPFVKVGRNVRYRVGDIQAYIAANTVTHTGEKSD